MCASSKPWPLKMVIGDRSYDFTMISLILLSHAVPTWLGLALRSRKRTVLVTETSKFEAWAEEESVKPGGRYDRTAQMAQS